MHYIYTVGVVVDDLGVRVVSNYLPSTSTDFCTQRAARIYLLWRRLLFDKLFVQREVYGTFLEGQSYTGKYPLPVAKCFKFDGYKMVYIRLSLAFSFQ